MSDTTDKIKDGLDKGVEATKDAARKAGDVAHDVGRAASDAARKAGDKAKDSGQATMDAGKNAVDAVDDPAHEAGRKMGGH